MLMIIVGAVWYFLSGDGWRFLWFMEAALRGGSKWYFNPSNIYFLQSAYMGTK